MKLTCSNRAILGKLDQLGEDHDIKLKMAKETTDGNKALQTKVQLLEVRQSRQLSKSVCDTMTESTVKLKNEISSLKRSFHPGFVIAFDNIDIELKRKNMTLSAQNRNFHWVNHQMVINRISGNELAADRPKADLLKVPNLRFIPTLVDHQQQRENYIVLVSRMLVDYFDALEPLNEICIKHIPHKYHKEMSQKSVKVHYNTVIVMLYYISGGHWGGGGQRGAEAPPPQ